MNILITCSANKVSLIRKFRQIGCKVLAVDHNLNVASRFVADWFAKVPMLDDPLYNDAIFNLIGEHKIDLIIPRVDPELVRYNYHRKQFEEKTKLCLSGSLTVNLCRDKQKTNSYLRDKGYPVPNQYTLDRYDSNLARHPLFLKPRYGGASVNCYKITSNVKLYDYLPLMHDYVLEDYLDGPEYTLDVMLDKGPKVTCVVPRHRISTRAGEIYVGRIVRDEELIDLGVNVGQNLPHDAVGPINIQCIKTREGPKVTEINPRLGSGVVFSIRAGADFAQWVVDLANGKGLNWFDGWTADLKFYRYDEEIMTHA